MKDDKNIRNDKKINLPLSGSFQIISIHFIFTTVLFLFSLSVDASLTANDLPVKLNCQDNICKCVRTDSFDVDTVVNYLKYNEVKDTALLACAYHQLSLYHYYYTDNQKKTIEYSKKAIKLREQFNDGWLWKSQLNLANYLIYWKDYAEAIKYAEKAKNSAGNSKQAKDSILIFRLLAEGYKEVGEFDKAVQFAEMATDINAAERNMIDALITYADVLISKADSLNVKKGMDCLDGLENILIHEEDTFNLSFVKSLFGKGLYFMKQYDKSIKYYDEALALQTDITSKAILSSNISSTFTEQGKFDIALKYLTQSLYLNRQYYKSNFHYLYASNYENYGDYYGKQNQLDSSIINYQKALINLSNNFRNDTIFKNPNINDTTLFIYSNPDMIRVLHLKATAAFKYYQQNKNREYLTLSNQTYQTAFDFHDELQKDISTENSRLFQAKNIVPYIENALKVAYEQQENGQDISNAAFRFMEKNKATVLLQSMNEADALQFANLPDSLLEKEKDLKIAIAVHNQEQNEAIENEEIVEAERLKKILFNEKLQYDKLIEHLENNYPNYYQLKYQQNQTQLVDVQNQLDDKSALLEYFVGDSAVYVLSIQKNQSKLYQMNKPKNWQQTIDNFLSTLNPKEVMKDEYTDVLYKNFTQNSYALYKNLLQQPLADLNESIANLQIIPDAELNYIPFDLLLTNKANEKEVDYRTLSYLLKQKAISYAYSAAFLLENKIETEEKAPYNYAGFASSYENNSSYQPLKATAQNVQNIANVLNGNSWIGKEATKTNFLQTQRQFNIIQLAMHGILDDENPLNSKLIFTKKDNTSDFELLAYELYNMQVPAQLAVLSACETGLGPQAKGEGIMSLSRAFTYAGCNSLVMSLWSIEDQATADIVHSFFKYLKKGKTKNEALRQAKLNFLLSPSHLKSHPVYWAGLVQSGDTSSIDFGKPNFWWIVVLTFFGAGLGFWKYRNSSITI